MEIIKNFGLDPYLIIAQVINFLAILYVLKRFLYPAILKMHRERQELAKQTVANAEQSQKALDSAEAERQEILRKARVSADQLVQDAKDRANLIVVHAEERAKIQSERMIEEARAQILRESESAEKSLTKRVGAISVDLLRKTLPGMLSTKDQEQVVDRALKEIQV